MAPQSNEVKCAICAGRIENLAQTGRPARYCSIACRRTAEAEARRLTRSLERVEAQISAAHTGGNIPVLGFDSPAAALAAYEAERDRLTHRLRTLYESLDGETP